MANTQINIEPHDQFLVAIRDVIKKLDKQAKVSRKCLAPEDIWTCAYRGSNEGEACAVGHLIADEFYSPDIEGISLNDVELLKYYYRHGDTKDVLVVAIEKSLGFELNRKMFEALKTMQEVHDEIWSPDQASYSDALRRYLTPNTCVYLEEALKYV